MNIILDITRLLRRINNKQTLTGIDRVTVAYAEHFQTQAQALLKLAGRYFILSHQDSKKLLHWLVNPQKPCKLWPMLIRTCGKSKIQRGSILINTGNISVKTSSYQQLIKKHHLKPIFFIHDLIPISYPEFCSPGEEQRLLQKLQLPLNHAQGIIANSQQTLQEFANFCTANNYPKIPGIVAKLASNVAVHKEQAPPIDKPYFVMLSTIEARKNHLLILQIFRKLLQENKPVPKLYIIGKRGWEAEQVFDLLDRSKILRNTVFEIPNCSDQELQNYLRHSQALLFPSFAEGYGLPLIEALNLGTPVIASDLAVFREIAENIPEYIDPIDSKAWEMAIMDYSSVHSIKRKTQLRRLQTLSPPTWQQHFAAVDKLIAQT